MKSKEDWKRAAEIVRSIINEWDPYSLLAEGAPDDEFEGEIASIVRQLPRIRSNNDMILAISTVFSSAFESERFRPEDCAEVGARLFDRLKEASLLVAN
jgi:hypothetical protein